MTIWMSRNLRSRGDREIMQKYCIKSSSNICFGYLLESPHWGDSNKYSKHVLYEEINIKQGRSFLHIILSINDSLQQLIHFNGDIFWNKCCRCNEGSLYVLTSENIQTEKSIYSIVLYLTWLVNVKWPSADNFGFYKRNNNAQTDVHFLRQRKLIR